MPGCDVSLEIVQRVGPVLRDHQVVVAEQVHGDLVLDVVELVDQHDVGAGPLDRLRHVAGLLVLAGREVGDELSVGGAVQRGVERREPDLLGVPLTVGLGMGLALGLALALV